MSRQPHRKFFWTCRWTPSSRIGLAASGGERVLMSPPCVSSGAATVTARYPAALIYRVSLGESWGFFGFCGQNGFRRGLDQRIGRSLVSRLWLPVGTSCGASTCVRSRSARGTYGPIRVQCLRRSEHGPNPCAGNNARESVPVAWSNRDADSCFSFATRYSLKSSIHQPSSHSRVTFRHPIGTCG